MSPMIQFCDVCLISFAAACRAASDTSPLRRAECALGRDRFLTEASRAMREAVHAELLEDPKARVDELAVHGALALQAMVTGVVQRTVAGVIRAAAVIDCAA